MHGVFLNTFNTNNHRRQVDRLGATQLVNMQQSFDSRGHIFNPKHSTSIAGSARNNEGWTLITTPQSSLKGTRQRHVAYDG